MISDISRMPGRVIRFFALPGMREYSYRILLSYDAMETQWIPRQEDSVTCLTVQENRVNDIDCTQSGKQLAGLTTPDSADRW